MQPSQIFGEFPAPGFRGAQEQALSDIQDAFQNGADVVLVRAPTGSGKSLLARAIAGCARTKDSSDKDAPCDAYYTTPQVSQLDDVADDDLLEDLNIVRGKNNYSCILPGHTDTPVSQAKCVRDSSYECDVIDECPYFSDRLAAEDGRIAAMTLAYFMQTAGSELFDQRDVIVIDEAHGLGDWAEMYGTISLSQRTVPMWDDIRVPSIDSLGQAVAFCEHLYELSGRRLNELKSLNTLDSEETGEREQLYRLRGDISWLLKDHESNAGTDDREWVADQSDDGTVQIKPLNPERYLKHTIWDRGQKFALLSATILSKNSYCRQVGLDPANVSMVTVPHTFPVEYRPLYDVTQGAMTYEERDETLPKIAEVIARIMRKHRDQKGLIHCHSYDIQDKLHAHLADLGVEERLRKHSAARRDEQLDAWKESRSSDVFLSVKMEEALDLSDELCRWQVLCKAPYENTRDSRVATRLENGRWGWYYRTALETVIQACGRVVRGPDDYGATYIADSSLLDVFSNARHDMPQWFKEQVDRMSTPSLPPLVAQGN